MDGNATSDPVGTATTLWRILAVVGLAVALTIAAIALRRAPKQTGETMPFLEHVEELRRRILWSLATWIGASMLVFGTRIETNSGIPYPWPSTQDNIAAATFRIMADHLVPPDVRLVVLRPIDGFLAEFTIALALGFGLALPFLIYHAGRFLGPALKPNEQRILHRAFWPMLGLFAAGVTFCWTFVLPFILRTLYGYGDALGAELLLSIPDLIQFSITFLLIFGISFQLPLLMTALTKAGLTTPNTYTTYWRHATIAVLIFSALITDPTIISQLMVAGPLVALYGVGVIGSRIAFQRRINSAKRTPS